MTYTDDDLFDDEGTGRPPRERSGRSRPTGNRPAARRPSGANRGPRRPSGGGGGAGAVLQSKGARLAILVGLVLVVLLVLITSVRGCQRDKLESSYKSYMTAANSIGGESQNLGQEMQVLLDNKTFKAPSVIGQEIGQLATRASDLAARANKLSPPDALKAANRTLITVMEYRRDGFKQLSTAVSGAGAGAADQDNVRASLLEPLKILGASDVIFKQSFLRPVEVAFADDKIKGINASPSYIFPDGAFNDASDSGVQAIYNNLKQARPGTTTTGQTGSGLHGLDIQSVFAIANGQRYQLSQASAVSVPASADLVIEVTVEDGGDFRETNIPVELVYTTPSDTTGQKQTQTISSIDPGASNAQKVTFRIPVPYTRAQSTIKVTATPVAGEVKTDNNTASYPVLFQVSG